MPYRISTNNFTNWIQRRYAIQVITIKRLDGFYDFNFEVKTSTDKFFIKVYTDDPLPSVRFHSAFIKRAFESAIAVGEIIISRRKHDVEIYKGWPVVVQRFLPGKLISERLPQSKLARHLGKCLGQLHAATHLKVLPGNSQRRDIWDLKQFFRVIELYPKVVKQLSPDEKILIEKVVADWAVQRARLSKLSIAYAHNDFHGWNLLVEGDRCSGIIDFGDARRTWLLADVATAVFHLFLWHKDGISLARVFCVAYSKEFTLPKWEWKMLPTLCRLRGALLLVGNAYALGPNPKARRYRILKYRARIGLSRLDDARFRERLLQSVS